MPEDTLHPILLADYQPPAYRLETVDLNFDLDEDVTRVTSRLAVSSLPETTRQTLHLDGHELELLSIKLDGKPLASDQFEHDSEQLTIYSPPDHFTLEIETAIKPQKNTFKFNEIIWILRNICCIFKLAKRLLLG